MPGAGWWCCCSPSSAMLPVAAVELEEEPGHVEEEAVVAGGCAGAFALSPVAAAPLAVALRWQGPSRLVLPRGTAWGSWDAHGHLVLATAPQPPGSLHWWGGFMPQFGQSWGPSGDPPAEPPGTSTMALSPLCCWLMPSASSATGCSSEHQCGEGARAPG